jgi:hypothetical protein
LGILLIQQRCKRRKVFNLVETTFISQKSEPNEVDSGPSRGTDCCKIGRTEGRRGEEEKSGRNTICIWDILGNE